MLICVNVARLPPADRKAKGPWYR